MKRSFDGVSERVPKIEGLAKACFVFILRNNACFDLNAACDGVYQIIGIICGARGTIRDMRKFTQIFRAECMEQLSVFNHAVFDDFSA